MGWEDRQYSQDNGGQIRNPLLFLVFGSIPLFTAFGIRVRAHMWLVFFIGTTLLLGGIGTKTYIWQVRAESMSILFMIVLLHEFGHCFAARWVGGDADQIMMTPLGGLASAHPPRRPLPTFITVAAGPAVNVVICVLMAVALYALTGGVPWNPYKYFIDNTGHVQSWAHVSSYLYWIYTISLAILLFNLLPIYPFDGGQMLQAILWPKFGYYRSMMFACVTGIIGGIILGMFGLMTGSLLLVFIAMSGVYMCISIRRNLRETGSEYEFGNEVPDFSASLRPDPPSKKRKRASRWVVRRLRREAQRESAEQQLIDTILAKVSAQGMHSLTWSEKRALRRATERQRKHEVEMSRRN